MPVTCLTTQPWYGVLKKGLLTLSSCSLEEATQISESVSSNHDRHSGSGALTYQ